MKMQLSDLLGQVLLECDEIALFLLLAGGTHGRLPAVESYVVLFLIAVLDIRPV
jgi:hypothetical protein